MSSALLRTGISASAIPTIASPTILPMNSNIYANGYTLPRTDVNRSVEDTIFANLNSTALKRYQYPLIDLPKYNLTLIENDIYLTRGNITGLTPEKIYKLPLPSPMSDSFSVPYKQDYSALNGVATVAGALTGAFMGIAGGLPGILVGTLVGAGAAGQAAQTLIGIADSVGSLIGTKLNTFKTITLDSPEFRQFEMNWKLIPRNYTEARQIQSIITSLKRGAAAHYIGSDKTENSISLLYGFPKIYTLFFQPNTQFLYKFKPCVLRAISIHYDGGSGAPAFYRPENGIIQNSPFESVVINTNWLEIEFWNYANYKNDSADNQMPSPNPLDAFSESRYSNLALPTTSGINLVDDDIIGITNAAAGGGT